MDKRAFERIPVNLEVEYICNNTVYSGTVKNISRNGMFVDVDELCFPFNSPIELVFSLKKDVLRVSADLNRIVMSPDSHDSIGVELSKPSQDYLDFISSYKAAVKR